MNKLFVMMFSYRKKLAFLSIALMAVIGLVNGYDDLMEKTATYMPIDNIKIEGKFENLAQMDIQQTVRAVLQGGYFTVDIGSIQQALMALPWVEDVSVRRQWPAGLNIAVTEKSAIAYWGKDRLLSDKGELFSPESISYESVMPYLDGPDTLHKAVWGFLKDTNKKFKDLDVVVKRLVLDKRRSWEMQLSNDVTVKLGREDTENRLKRFIRVFKLRDKPDMQKIESIDLRYPNGFAMRMKKNEAELHKNTLVKEV